jgi:hypothetical protein
VSVLGVSSMDINTGFDAGGDSLLASRLLVKEGEFGKTLSIVDFSRLVRECHRREARDRGRYHRT